MRTFLLELRPSALTKTPLSDLLTQLSEAVTSRSGLSFKLFIEKIPILPENVQINFYRIAQEALNNVVKHAQARQVTLSLNTMPLTPDLTGELRYEVKLVIQDDGVGYSSGKSGQPNWALASCTNAPKPSRRAYPWKASPGPELKSL